MDYKKFYFDETVGDTSEHMEVKAFRAVLDYLGLPYDVWLATTINSDGWRQDYITEPVLDKRVDKLIEDAKDDREAAVQSMLEFMDAYEKQRKRKR